MAEQNLLNVRQSFCFEYKLRSLHEFKEMVPLTFSVVVTVKISGSVENLTSEEKNKIRAQLKKFFNRRPARESLVKKGIYKG